MEWVEFQKIVLRLAPVVVKDNQSFEHWIFKCDALASFRWNSLNFINDLSCGSGESLVDTTLSILKILLLCFIILDLTGDHVTTHSIHHIEIFITFKLIFILYYIKYSLIN